jgi:hypothetical protein
MRHVIVTVTVLAVLVTVLAVPASADPPQRVEEPVFTLIPDVENGLAAFVNITRENFCDWEAGGFVGPPPVNELVEVTRHETGQGAIVVAFRAEVRIELWTFDEDVPPLVGPCEDTDGQAGPWATGIARLELNDNDQDVSGTRANSFGDRGQATVYDADGDAWHYSWTFRALISRDGEFTVSAENTNLKRKGA